MFTFIYALYLGLQYLSPFLILLSNYHVLSHMMCADCDFFTILWLSALSIIVFVHMYICTNNCTLKFPMSTFAEDMFQAFLTSIFMGLIYGLVLDNFDIQNSMKNGLFIAIYDFLTLLLISGFPIIIWQIASVLFNI